MTASALSVQPLSNQDTRFEVFFKSYLGTARSDTHADQWPGDEKNPGTVHLGTCPGEMDPDSLDALKTDAFIFFDNHHRRWNAQTDVQAGADLWLRRSHTALFADRRAFYGGAADALDQAAGKLSKILLVIGDDGLICAN